MKSKYALVVLLWALLAAPGAWAEQNEHHGLRIYNKKHFDTEPLKNGESHNRRYIKKKASGSGQVPDAVGEQNSQRDPASESDSSIERQESPSPKQKHSGVR